MALDSASQSALFEQINILAARVVALTAENKLLKHQKVTWQTSLDKLTAPSNDELWASAPALLSSLHAATAALTKLETEIIPSDASARMRDSSILLAPVQVQRLTDGIGAFREQMEAEVHRAHCEVDSLREQHMQLVTEVEDARHIRGRMEALLASQAAAGYAVEMERAKSKGLEEEISALSAQLVHRDRRIASLLDSLEEFQYVKAERDDLDTQCTAQQGEVDRLLSEVETLRARLARYGIT